MRKKVLLAVITICVSLFLINGIVLAHPGRTDSNGGHYVRKSGWGYPVGSYHYHNGGSSSGGYSSGSSGSSSSTTYVETKPKLTVSIPTYKVAINNQIYNSANSKYPVLVYNYITYIPLTSDVCNALGIGIKVDSVYEIVISNKEPVLYQCINQFPENINRVGKKYSVEYPSMPQVNSKTRYSNLEDYPIFQYNYIYYLPLTSENAKAFGFNINWNETEGLAVSI